MPKRSLFGVFQRAKNEKNIAPFSRKNDQQLLFV